MTSRIGIEDVKQFLKPKWQQKKYSTSKTQRLLVRVMESKRINAKKETMFNSYMRKLRRKDSETKNRSISCST